MGHQSLKRIARMKISNGILHGILLTFISNVRADDQDFEYTDDFSNEDAREDDFQQVHLGKGVGYAICSGTESYYTVDPDDCHNFYGCVYDDHTDSFHVYKFECQEGLAYDEASHSCQDETTVDRCWYTCSDGWDLFENSCYFFSTRNTKGKSFTEALEECHAMDAYLVEIESKAEDDFIIEKALSLVSSTNDGLDYWIGAKDSDGNGVWNWVTSGNPLIYTNWWSDPGRLNSTCVQLLKNGMTNPKKLDSFYWTMAAGNYKDEDCKGDGDNAFICEKNPNV